MTPAQRIFSYSKRYWPRLALSGAMTTLFGLCAALPAYLLEPAVDRILHSNQVGLLVPFTLCFVGTYYLKSVFMYLSNYYMEHVGNSVVRDIRHDLFARVISFPLPFFSEKPTGEMIAHFINDVDALQEASSRSIRLGIRSCFEALFLLAIALKQSLLLAGVMAIVGPIIGYAIRQLGKKMRKTAHDSQERIGTLSTHLQETLRGMRQIKASNGELSEVARFDRHLQGHFKAIMGNVRVVSLAPALIEATAMSGMGVVLYIALGQVLSGALTGGQLASFFAATILAYQPLKRLINVYADLQSGIAAAQRIFAVMESSPSQEAARPKHLAHFCTSIQALHLSFGYRSESWVLNDISGTLSKGERIGIIGSSGSGKSTLCDLLLGFISPSQGSLRIDGNDITSLSRHSLRTHIGYVSQDTFLFNDTIQANIAYAKQNASFEQIKKAAERAHADQFIMGLPHGYNTIVGEDGTFLSGGQKQRITIARALLKDPSIFIFDEATSALDGSSQEAIQRTIAQLDRSKTVIVISHRYSFVENLDRIFKLDQGRLTEVTKKFRKYTPKLTNRNPSG